MSYDSLKHCEKCTPVIFGQTKPLLNYITAVVSLFNQNYDHLYFVARGEAINKLVDTFNKTKAAFISALYYNDNEIEIGSETIGLPKGGELTLPTMRVVVRRKRHEQTF